MVVLSMDRRRSIAIVDDDDSFREALYELLKSYDFDVRAFSSVEALFGSSAQLDADCLLVDATIPGAGSVVLMQRLQQSDRPVPIIFVTGYGGTEVRSHVMANGALDCLSKPFEEEDLLAAVTRAIGVF